MPQASAKTKQKRPKNVESENGSAGSESASAAESGPSMSDRASAGMRIASHVSKAASGGKLRKGFSLWRASRELPTAAAGATEVFKKHPIPVAIAGGLLAPAGLLYAAHAMGAFDADESAGQQDDEQDTDASAEAQGEEDEGAEEESEEEDE